MVSSHPSVGILTVTYNSAAFIEEFAHSLQNIDYPRAHLIVVDNASSDDTLQRLAAVLPQATIHRATTNLGFAGGSNWGIRYCLAQGYDYILFLNNDTVVTPNFLTILLRAADLRTIAIPKILYYDDPRFLSTHAGDFDWSRGVFRRTFHGRRDEPAANQRREVHTASFCCALVPAQAFTEVGLLDEQFFMYYEETDWLARARRYGYRLIYEPEAVIYHRESGSSGGGWMTPLKLYYATRNRPYLLRKHVKRAAYLRFLAYFWLSRPPLMAWYGLRGEWRLLRALWLGLLHSAQGRMGRTLEVSDL